ncbi:MAG: hypothetical protein EBR09_12890 [Proteobacteria bacterium]|nr:hypothetical protein [Pseudomonadota bacterium]
MSMRLPKPAYIAPLLFLLWCGQKNQYFFQSDDFIGGLVSVRVGMQSVNGERAQGGSDDADAMLIGNTASVKAAVSGCKSGFTETIDTFTPIDQLKIRFDRDDSNCQIRLTAIRLKASGSRMPADYEVPAGSPESAYAVAGLSPSAEGKIYTSSINLTQNLVVKDTHFDLKSDGSPVFTFQLVPKETKVRKPVSAEYSQALGTQSLGAPNFEIPFDSKFPESTNNGLSLSDTDPVYSEGKAKTPEANGGFQIDVLLRCSEDKSLGSAGQPDPKAVCPTAAGDDMPVSDLQMAVIMCRSNEDRLSYEQAAALFASVPSSRVMQGPSKFAKVIKSSAVFNSTVESDFVTGLLYEGVRTHFPVEAVAGTSLGQGCVFSQFEPSKGWLILRKTQGAGASEVSSYQVTNVQLSAVSAEIEAVGSRLSGLGKISRSLRFSSDNQNFLSRTKTRTPAPDTSLTVSLWVKFSKVNSDQQIFESSSATGFLAMGYFGKSSGGRLVVTNDQSGAYANAAKSDYPIQDPRVWNHVVYSRKHNGQGILYVNGVEQSVKAVKTVNIDFFADAGRKFGSRSDYSKAFTKNERYGDFLLADVHVVDGIVLGAESFGLRDANGKWQPKEYRGSHGAMGFHLNFADNSSNTAETLGKDSSGNKKHWTPHNFKVSPDGQTDSLVDSPSAFGNDSGAGGEVRGNYVTLSPLAGNSKIRHGNLETFSDSVGWYFRPATRTVNSGKWYYESTVKDGLGADESYSHELGISSGSVNAPLPVTHAGQLATGHSILLSRNRAAYWTEGTSTFVAEGDFSAGAVLKIAVDVSAGKAWLGVNGNWLRQGNPAEGQNPTFEFKANSLVLPIVSNRKTADLPSVSVTNFGQKPFKYRAPVGFGVWIEKP